MCMSEKDFENVPTIRIEVSIYERENQSWLARHIMELWIGSIIFQLLVLVITAVMFFITNVNALFLTNVVGIGVGVIMMLAGYYEKDYYRYYKTNYILGAVVALLNIVVLIPKAITLFA